MLIAVQRLWSYDITALYKSVYYYYKFIVSFIHIFGTVLFPVAAAATPHLVTPIYVGLSDVTVYGHDTIAILWL